MIHALCLLFAAAVSLPLPVDEDALVPCITCGGEGLAALPCAHCKGDGKRGNELAWVVTADRLIAAGRLEAANAHMQVAIERAGARHRVEIAAFAGHEEQRKSLQKELDNELDSLRRRLARMARAE